MIKPSKNNSQVSASNYLEDNSCDLVFEANDLCWNVGQVEILKKLNFQIKRNQFVGVIGPNGAGKSSLLRCLFRQNLVSSGRLKFQQQDISSYSRKALADRKSVV